MQRPILPPIAPALQNAVRFSLAVQIPLLLLSAFVADYGETAQMFYFGFLAFNALLFMVLLRRRNCPTKLDLFIIRTGFLPLIVGTYFMAFWIWKMRGF